ncbi:hypothetical protein Anapl_00105 [Anas platyrhynchos]|uniref:Uncharacterized protein n=1 Tax=Anas platyrhynchos TaxID=8839 RepID=R0K1L4_ANAPL|nr:hypothetical protein Anapl_00105 [Anas platyrhynchos]
MTVVLFDATGMLLPPLPALFTSEGCQLAEGEIAGAIADEVTGIWRWKWVPEGTDTGSLKLHLVTSTLSLLSIDLRSYVHQLVQGLWRAVLCCQHGGSVPSVNYSSWCLQIRHPFNDTCWYLHNIMVKRIRSGPLVCALLMQHARSPACCPSYGTTADNSINITSRCPSVRGVPSPKPEAFPNPLPIHRDKLLVVVSLPVKSVCSGVLTSVAVTFL